MRCPLCDQQTRVREGMVCQSCQYRFTFQPRGDRMADGKFTAIIRRASQQGTAYFTDNQLYAAYIRGLKSPKIFVLVTGVLLLLAGIVLGLLQWQGYWILLGFGVLVSLLSLITRPYSVNRDQFQRWIKRWKEDGKEIPNMITEPQLHSPPPDWPEEDLFDYGVERVLIVQQDLMVDLLVLNNIHAQQRMLVISESGYPNYLLPQLRKCLDQRPDLPIFLLHDADDDGTSMRRRLEKSHWLPWSQHPVTDLGFFPEDFRKLKRTTHYDYRNRKRGLPADALLLGSLTLGLAACFQNQSTFAQELVREAQNQATDGSHFG